MSAGDGVEVGRVFVTLEGRTAEFMRAFSASAQHVESQTSKMGAALANFGKEFSLYVSVPILGYLEEATRAFIKHDDALTLLEATLAATGTAAEGAAEQIEGLAKSISETTRFSGDAVESAASVLLSFESMRTSAGGLSDSFDETVKLSADLATKMGGDVPQAARMLGRALEGGAGGMNMLRRAGVTLTDTQKAMVQALYEAGNAAGAQAYILDVLSQKVGGLADAMGKNLGGRIENAASQLHKTLVIFGDTIAPMVEKLADLVAGLAKTAQWLEKVSPGLIQGGAAAGFLLAAIGPLALGISKLITLWGFLGTTFVGPFIALLPVVGLTIAAFVSVRNAGKALIDNWEGLRLRAIIIWTSIKHVIADVFGGDGLKKWAQEGTDAMLAMAEAIRKIEASRARMGTHISAPPVDMALLLASNTTHREAEHQQELNKAFKETAFQLAVINAQYKENQAMLQARATLQGAAQRVEIDAAHELATAEIEAARLGAALQTQVMKTTGAMELAHIAETNAATANAASAKEMRKLAITQETQNALLAAGNTLRGEDLSLKIKDILATQRLNLASMDAAAAGAKIKALQDATLKGTNASDSLIEQIKAQQELNAALFGGADALDKLSIKQQADNAVREAGGVITTQEAENIRVLSGELAGLVRHYEALSRAAAAAGDIVSRVFGLHGGGLGGVLNDIAKGTITLKEGLAAFKAGIKDALTSGGINLAIDGFIDGIKLLLQSESKLEQAIRQNTSALGASSEFLAKRLEAAGLTDTAATVSKAVQAVWDRSSFGQLAGLLPGSNYRISGGAFTAQDAAALRRTLTEELAKLGLSMDAAAAVAAALGINIDHLSMDTLEQFGTQLDKVKDPIDKLADAAKELADAATEAERALSFRENLFVRGTRAAGMGPQAAMADLLFGQRRELATATTPAEKAMLEIVQQMERAGLETQQAIDAIRASADQQVAELEKQSATANEQLQVLQEQLSAQRETVNSLRGLVESLSSFSRSLSVGPLSVRPLGDQFADARAQFDALVSMARGGDIKAGQDLVEAGQALIELSKNFSQGTYMRTLTSVQSAVDSVGATFGAQLDVQEAILSELEKQTGQLGSQIALLQSQIISVQQGAEATIANINSAHALEMARLYEMLVPLLGIDLDTDAIKAADEYVGYLLGTAIPAYRAEAYAAGVAAGGGGGGGGTDMSGVASGLALLHEDISALRGDIRLAGENWP